MIDALLTSTLLRLDPEVAHHRALSLLATAAAVPGGVAGLAAMYRPTRVSPVTVAGLTFPNRVGLAAGYDKDALAWKALPALGFGHVEVGTVTPRPQQGNPTPRVFRVPGSNLINRMGFPSVGAAVVRQRLDRDRPYGCVLGVNLGRNKETPNEEAARDYVAGVRTFAEVADYLAVNVSSPNTPGLRALQSGPALRALLREVVVARDAASLDVGRAVPVFVKLAPDLDEADLADALGAVSDAGVDGVIATNTTLSRDGVPAELASEAGGLSGTLLTARATEVLRQIRRLAGDKLPVIGVGGITTADDAKARIDAGADLVQLYTGLVYAGPGLVRAAAEAIAR